MIMKAECHAPSKPLFYQLNVMQPFKVYTRILSVSLSINVQTTHFRMFQIEETHSI